MYCDAVDELLEYQNGLALRNSQLAVDLRLQVTPIAVLQHHYFQPPVLVNVETFYDVLAVA